MEGLEECEFVKRKRDFNSVLKRRKIMSCDVSYQSQGAR